MDAEKAELAWQAITVIEAQESLVGFKVSGYPYMSKNAQEKAHRSLHRLAYPSTYERRQEVTPQQLAAILHG